MQWKIIKLNAIFLLLCSVSCMCALKSNCWHTKLTNEKTQGFDKFLPKERFLQLSLKLVLPRQICDSTNMLQVFLPSVVVDADIIQIHSKKHPKVGLKDIIDEIGNRIYDRLPGMIPKTPQRLKQIHACDRH
jgi:hypothetical protein